MAAEAGMRRTPHRRRRCPGCAPDTERSKAKKAAVAERLERRLLLACSSVDITAVPKQLLKDGLAKLDQWADTVDQYATLAQSLPVIGESVGIALDMSNVLHEQLT